MKPQTLLDLSGTLRVVVLAGVAAGRRYEVRGGEVIGRSEECAVQVNDLKVSRTHARFSRDGDGQLWLEDLGSRNGTSVNGLPITRHRLKAGDKIALGEGTVLLVHRDDPSERQEMRRQRLELLGQIGAGLAHDLRNLQTVVMAGVEYLRQTPPGTSIGASDVHECLDDVYQASSRATELAARLLATARDDGLGFAPVDLSQLLQELTRLARFALGTRIRVETEIAAKVFVTGNEASLHQALWNLVLNARDAMPGGGTLRLRLGRSAAGEGSIEVSDTGTGMDEATRIRLFEPFFTTKESGSGVGLSTTLSIVSAHGGRIDVRSAPGRGARFTLLLPADESPVRRRASTPASFHGPVASPMAILIATEAKELGRSLARVLARAGHSVATVLSADELTAACRKRGQEKTRLDVVIVDGDLPDAEEALELARQRHPTARVVMLADSGPRTLADAFLPKPVGAFGLLECVHSVATDDFEAVTESRAIPNPLKRSE